MPDSLTDTMPSLGADEPGSPGECLAVDVGSPADMSTVSQHISPLREEEPSVTTDRRSPLSDVHHHHHHQHQRCSAESDSELDVQDRDRTFESNRLRPANSSPSHSSSHHHHTSNNNNQELRPHHHHSTAAVSPHQRQQQQQHDDVANGPKLTPFSVLDILDPKKFRGTTLSSPATSPIHNGNISRVSTGRHWSSWSPPASPASSCRSDGKNCFSCRLLTLLLFQTYR